MSKSVFVCYGRDLAAKAELVKFLHALGLDIVSWSRAREAIGIPNPSLLEVALMGMKMATATVVLLTPDDTARLQPALGSERSRRQSRPNVIFELGISLALAPTNTVVLKIGESHLMSDLEGLSISTLNNTSHTRMDFIRRLQNAGCDVPLQNDEWMDPAIAGDFDQDFPSFEPVIPETPWGADQDDSLVGALFTPYLIDTSLSLELSQETLIEETRRRIREGQDLDLKYHYVGPQLAAHWKAVVKEPQYGHEVIEQLDEENLPIILKAAGIENEVALLSLGPGDGKIDTSFLMHIVEKVESVSYHLVDISVDLLQVAVQSVQSHEELSSVPVRAYLADFEKSLHSISLLIGQDHRKVIFLLTGFTLGNSREATLLDAVENAMHEDDSLLLDVRLHPHGTMPKAKMGTLKQADIDSMMAPYSSEAVRRFAYGPIEIATNYSLPFNAPGTGVTFGTEARLGHSTVPDAITVFMTCDGLFKNDDVHDLFNKNVGISQRTAQAMDRSHKSIRLAQVTFYNLDSLAEWLSHRFEILWSLDAKTVGLFLLRRKKHT